MNHKDRLKSWLEQSRQTSEQMLASFKTPQEWTHQVHPTANHALWFAGHMSQTDNFIVGIVAPDRKAEVPAGFKEKFGMGSKPTSNPADYPPAEDVLRYFRDRRQALFAELNGLGSQAWLTGTDIEPFAQLQGSVQQIVAPALTGFRR